MTDDIDTSLDAVDQQIASLQIKRQKIQQHYRGWVKALTLCIIGGERRAQGSLFEIDVPALHTDDPFVPVKITGYDMTRWPRELIYEPLDLPRLPAESRQSGGDGLR